MLQVTANNNASGVIANVVFLAILVIAIINFFAAYYSFNLSRLLVDTVQKTRAIWTAALSILLSVTTLAFILAPTSGPYSGIFVVPLIAFVLALSGLVDSTIRVAIDQDYFHRNTLHWKKLRFLFWAGILFIFVANPLFLATGFSYIGSGLALSFLEGVVPFAYGIATLFVSGRRSKDRKMRSYLRWVGLAVVSFLGVAVVGNILGGAGAFLLVVVLAYFLYCAARSLSPTNRMEKGSEGMKLKPG